MKNLAYLGLDRVSGLWLYTSVKRSCCLISLWIFKSISILISSCHFIDQERSVMKDAVAAQLAQSNFDEVMADHFNDEEHFIIYARNQDYDLDTCHLICDSVELLNQDTSERNIEQRDDMAAADSDFKEIISMEEKEFRDLESGFTDGAAGGLF